MTKDGEVYQYSNTFIKTCACLVYTSFNVFSHKVQSKVRYVRQFPLKHDSAWLRMYF